jgi:inward rectifier potassium channel
MAPDKKTDELELGFGYRGYRKSVRFINRDGSVNISRTGLGLNNIDIYHWLISASRVKLFAVILLSYLAINIVFAIIYYFIGAESFGGVDKSSEFQKFMSLFFFSAQTITTLGYGHIYPTGVAASTAAAIESLLGLLSFAIATGILFGRFSRPKAHILYSHNALFAPYEGITGFMFRITNKKQYELIECEASLTMTMNDPLTGKRKFYNLELEISRINFLSLTWTIVHPIDQNSPLFGLSPAQLNDRDVEILVLIKGINDTFSQAVHSRYSYKANDIVENAKFRPMQQEPDRKGRLRIVVNDVHLYDKTG